MLIRAALVSAVLSAIMLQATPTPYGLPGGATPGTDTTAQDGTRTITYEREDGSTVTVEIALDGSTTETTEAKDGTKTTRTYDTTFNTDGTRTETYDEGAGRTRRKTVDQNGRRRASESVEETPVEGDSTTTRRVTRRTEWDANGDRTSVTTTTEDVGLVPGWNEAIKRRRSQTDTFDANGNRTSRTREDVTLIRYDEDRQFPIYEGTRTIRTRNAQGEIETKRERLDPDTQQWAPAPEPEPESPEQTSEGPARRAGYVSLSPGFIHIALPSSVGYQWAARGGVELPCSGPCAVAVGASFQHSVGSANFHQLRTQAEVMPGARLVGDKLFVYADVGIGHVANVSSFELMGTTTRTTNHGVAFSVGAGLSYTVWRELFVGGRFGGDLQWFPSSGGTFASHNLALEGFVGWRFGF